MMPFTPSVPYAPTATSYGYPTNQHPPFQPGMAYQHLGYEWTPPQRGYEVNPAWGAWELAREHYGGDGSKFDKSWFDDIVCSPSAHYPYDRTLQQSQ
jgi:hypothetical protein